MTAHEGLKMRAAVLRGIRSFFDARDFLEVETPVRVVCPAVEAHIEAEPCGNGWLRTSPELHMKRLLVQGLDKIYQVGSCFRKGEVGRIHHPEYAMLEWYRAGVTDEVILEDTRDLLLHLCQEIHGGSRLVYQGEEIDFAQPWIEKSVRDTYREIAGWDPFVDWDADRFDLDLVEKIEPSFSVSMPVIFRGYPREAAALSVCETVDEVEVGRRWELYLGGMELANAYTELTDPEEQRARFEAANAFRVSQGLDAYPLDEVFLESLEKGLPGCAGIALGVDRLVMLFADAASLDEVTAFREIIY